MKFVAIGIASMLLASSQAGANEDLVGFLEARHLVVDAVIVAIESNSWETAGGCDKPPESRPSRLDQYRIALKRTLIGSAPDSILVVRTLGRATKFPVGTRVLGFGDYVCVDGRMLWGDVIPWRDLADTLAARSNESGFAAFEHAAGIAIVRLKSITRLDNLRFSYTCDSLGWAIPTDARVPSTIQFSRPSLDCRPDTGPGVMLIVPIPRGFSSTMMEVTGCTNGWRIEDGIVAGFGVPPNELNRVLVREGTTFRVRSRVLPR